MKSNTICDNDIITCHSNVNTMEEIMIEKPMRKLDFYYVTDPLCSHCWEFEPVLQKLITHYGQHFNFKIVMAGMLKDWNEVSKSVDNNQMLTAIATQWHDLGEDHRMPISGKIWNTHPVNSSYPSSIVYKLLEQKDPLRARKFLRNAREAVMVWNRDIADDDILISLVNEIGFNGTQIVDVSHTAQGHALLKEDMHLAKELGVNSIPAVVIIDHQQKGMRITGHHDFSVYEEVLANLIDASVTLEKRNPPLLHEWLKEARRLYAKEIEVMYDLSINDLVPFVRNELDQVKYRVDEVINELYLEWE